ncbi:sugar transferase [Candidatus Saccharibacteria bacterium]|nr:sugar transferase [Candidatus Saccharibacteria bacterium]
MRNNTSIAYSICLMIGDFLAILLAFSMAYVLRVSLSSRMLSAQVNSREYFTIFLTLLPFWILIFGLLGLYNARVHEKRFSELGRLVVGSFIGILFAISYAYIANVAIFPARLVTVYGFGLALFFVLLFRTMARRIRRELFSYGVGINNVLIVGDTRTTHTLIQSLARTTLTGYRVVGIVGGSKHPHRSDTGYTVFKSFAEAEAALDNIQLHTIIQTELYANSDANDTILTYAQQNHIAYRFIPGNGELFSGKIEVDLFHSIPIIAVHQTALIGWGRVVKRIFDILAGSIGLVIASPVILLICLAMLFDKGDPLFAQKRLSRFGSEIKIFKFRTVLHAYNRMSPEQGFEKMGRPELALQYRANGDFLDNDPRISPLGRFLRMTSLDELPQLLNVVRGDISLVGPRPLEPFELEKYGQKSLLLSVKTGLTGLAVVSGRRDIPFEERRKLDLFYVQNWSFWGDIIIIIRTISVVLFHRGAR